jgi:hypothetical protein
MTDIDTLLAQAAQSPVAPASKSTVDADVARGHRALVHRNLRRLGTRTALAAVVAVGVVGAVHVSSGSSGTTSATTTPTTHVSGVEPNAANPSIKLVAYTGSQPDGYTVDSVPAGWEIQGVNNLALDIAPVGFADKDLNSFAGKLVVMLMSKDEKPPTTGVPVNVGVPGTGRISHFNPGPILTFQDSAGHWLDIQVPASLHWSDAQVAAFGAAVHANATAEAGVG